MADGLVHLAKEITVAHWRLFYRDDTDRIWKQTPARSSLSAV
jgi:hypothetical protein